MIAAISLTLLMCIGVDVARGDILPGAINKLLVHFQMCPTLYYHAEQNYRKDLQNPMTMCASNYMQ